MPPLFDNSTFSCIVQIRHPNCCHFTRQEKTQLNNVEHSRKQQPIRKYSQLNDEAVTQLQTIVISSN